MTQKSPKITIITVSLNSASTIEATINSVCSQTYRDTEYWVIDGGSADGTVEILDEYKHQGKLQYVSKHDNGIYNAMNKGIQLATGEWIFFLGSDDVFYNNDVVEKIFSKTYGAEEVIYGNVLFFHSQKIYDGPFNFEKISNSNICQQAIFYKKSLFNKIGGFNEKYKIYADHEFNIRWMGAQVASSYIDETIAVYNEKGISAQIIDDVFFNEYDDLLIKNNIVSSRSFGALQKKYQLLENSYRYKIGTAIIDPVIWLKEKLF